MTENWVTYLIVAVIGLVLGWLGDLMTGRRHGLMSGLAVGVVGAFLGDFIARVMELEFAGRWTGPTLAVVGAALLLITMAAVRRRA
ncbi:MAG TPA: GlsB/YeaQ/YmgE family stress response membrane protein [Caulobacteraceae bacterium]|jgi:uncharacterized membrane protein YeaQ/YmgE (transglycosylase-associated protein family)|nr:GlsB/YeaQ/YmgE family stress response membrane protein [Caulobacteraceae bacterium]